MNAADIEARVRRLDRLSRGIALKISIVSKAEDPVLERRAYHGALHATVRGLEATRVVLAQVRQRLL
jgi:hypothetical protein